MCIAGYSIKFGFKLTFCPRGQLFGSYRFLLFKTKSEMMRSNDQLNKIMGSLCVKSPNGLNSTVSDFNETWYRCCLGTHITKSEILGQSDLWYGRYDPRNFEILGHNGRGHLPLNPYIYQELLDQ